MKLQTLFKKTATGAINRWAVFIEENCYWTEFGQVNGVIQKSDKVFCQGKNKGRSNETSDEEQAILEANSAWNKKKDRDGFVTSYEQAESGEGVFEPPMLAKKYDGNYTEKMKFIQPKLDGIRCNISTSENGITALSRHNMRFDTTTHIENELKEFFETHNNVHLDGELYNHELHDDFNKIVSLVRKKKLTEEDKQEIEAKVKYYVYDAWFDGQEDMKFSDRSKFIKENLSNLNNIVVVPTFEIHSAEDTDGYFERFLEEGYEGAIIRGDEPYEHKRSKNLLKYKRFQDDEFEILDVKVGKNNTIAESVTIRLNNGNICSATLAFPDDKCKEILENKNNYIGKMATVCYFGMTNDKLLRFPIVKAIRDYE